MHVMDIDIKVFKTGPGEASAREKEDIQALKPRYNQEMSGNIYSCLCDPTKTYKRKADYEKHMNRVHREELDELTIRQDEDEDSDKDDSDQTQ